MLFYIISCSKVNVTGTARRYYRNKIITIIIYLFQYLIHDIAIYRLHLY